jgi:predicted dehydrogenase
MTSGLLGFPDGVQATFTVGMDTHCDNRLLVAGTEGYLIVDVPWKPPLTDAGYTLRRGTKPRQDLKPGETPVTPAPERIDTPSDLPLFALEARAFADHVRDGAEPFMPRPDSLRLASVMDQIRRQAGATG